MASSDNRGRSRPSAWTRTRAAHVVPAVRPRRDLQQPVAVADAVVAPDHVQADGLLHRCRLSFGFVRGGSKGQAGSRTIASLFGRRRPLVTIRLARHGAKKRPFYHVTVAEKSAPRDGRFIERIGFYNPIAQGGEVPLSIDLARFDHWLSRGALPTERVGQLAAQARRTQPAQQEAVAAEPVGSDAAASTDATNAEAEDAAGSDDAAPADAASVAEDAAIAETAARAAEAPAGEEAASAEETVKQP